jgi:methionyl-tRNA formyltransferase
MKYFLKTSLKVLLTANESAGVQALRLIHGSGHQIIGVVTEMDPPDQSNSESVRSLAQSLGLTVYPATVLKDASFANKLHDENVDLLLNVHLLRIIHPDILDVPAIGAFNVHPGHLPSYSGLNAPSWSIFNREETHHVTLHHMTPELDAGPIAYSELFEIKPDDTAFTVSMKCVKAGSGLILNLLRDAVYRPDEIPEIPQDRSKRRLYMKEDVPNGGVIPWHKDAEQIEAFVRACDYGPFPSPWGHPVSKVDRDCVEILNVSLTGEPMSEQPGFVRNHKRVVSVACGNEWLQINKCRVGGKTLLPHEVFPHRVKLSKLMPSIKAMKME